MTLSPTERKIVVGLELEKANSIFSQIEVLQNAGFWDNIANRLYYSLFHAVSALLINEGLPVNSHKGAVLLFGQYFIKTQVFDKQCVEFVCSIEIIGLALVGSIGDVFLCQFLDGSENGIRAACTKGRMIREMAHQL